MGYKTRGFLFSGWWSVDADVTGMWLGDDLVARALLAPLEPGGYLARADRLFVNLLDQGPIGGLDELRARAGRWRYDVISMDRGDPDDPEWRLHLGLDAVGPRVFVGIAAEQVTAQTREDIARWVAVWSRGLAAARCRLTHGRFEPTPDRYPRPIPPRQSPIWWLGSLDQYDGLAWHRSDPARSAVIERLLGAPLPAGAHRTVDGDVVRIGFDCELTSRASIEAARSAHERWLTPLVPTELERGWNERGDRWVIPVRPVVRAPFTMFDASNQVGYKALVVHPGGELDEEAWSQMKQIAAAGALLDGTKVASVRLIFPRREDALQLHARAIADGFEMATYPEHKGFWEVHPVLEDRS